MEELGKLWLKSLLTLSISIILHNRSEYLYVEIYECDLTKNVPKLAKEFPK